MMRLREHHVQEVAAVAQLRVGILYRVAQRHLVAEGRDGADLAHEDRRGRQELVFAEFRLQQLGMVAAAGVDHGREHRHGMAVRRETLEVVLHSLVQEFLLGQELPESCKLRRSWQLAEDQQPGRLDEGALLGKLLDGVTPVMEHALLAVDERDLALAGPGVAVAGIERDVTGLVSQRADVDGLLVLRPGDDRQPDILAGKLQNGRFQRCILSSFLYRKRHDFGLAHESKLISPRTSQSGSKTPCLRKAQANSAVESPFFKNVSTLVQILCPMKRPAKQAAFRIRGTAHLAAAFITRAVVIRSQAKAHRKPPACASSGEWGVRPRRI